MARRSIAKSKYLRLRAAILERDDFTCVYCGWRPTRTFDLAELVPDHVVPLALGGTWEIENLVCACWTCNSLKGTRPVEEWLLEWIGEAA